MISSRTFDGRIQLLEYAPTILAGPPAAAKDDANRSVGERGASAARPIPPAEQRHALMPSHPLQVRS
jgi:hypothetical protein